MIEFKSIEWLHMAVGEVAVVDSPVAFERTQAGMRSALGKRVRIDGKEYHLIGVEWHLTGGPVEVGERLGLLVASA